MAKKKKETKKDQEREKGKWSDMPPVKAVITENELSTGETPEAQPNELIAPIPRKPLVPTVQPPVPEKPSLIKFLTDYKVGKISRDQYLEKMKIHSKTAIEIYKRQADDAILAAKVWSRKNVELVKNITQSCLQEIMDGTVVSIRKSMENALVDLQKDLSDTLERLREQDAPPDVKQLSYEAAMKIWANGVKEIQERYYKPELIKLD